MDRVGERSEEDTFVAGGIPITISSCLVAKDLVEIMITTKAPVTIRVVEELAKK